MATLSAISQTLTAFLAFPDIFDKELDSLVIDETLKNYEPISSLEYE